MGAGGVDGNDGLSLNIKRMDSAERVSGHSLRVTGGLPQTTHPTPHAEDAGQDRWGGAGPPTRRSISPLGGVPRLQAAGLDGTSCALVSGRSFSTWLRAASAGCGPGRYRLRAGKWPFSHRVGVRYRSGWGSDESCKGQLSSGGAPWRCVRWSGFGGSPDRPLSPPGGRALSLFWVVFAIPICSN